MMFVDASAIIAMIAREEEGSALAARLDQASRVHVSAVVVYEAVLGLARAGNIAIIDAQAIVDRFIDEVEAEIVPIVAETSRVAVTAFDRFGKGRHPAGLNLGDCFAYACARVLDEPLLYKGDDFPRTDITAG